jgi:hypothetical protein
VMWRPQRRACWQRDGHYWAAPGIEERGTAVGSMRKKAWVNVERMTYMSYNNGR